MSQERFVGCLADVVYDGYDLLKNSVLTNVRVLDVCVVRSVTIKLFLRSYHTVLPSASHFSRQCGPLSPYRLETLG